MIGKILSRAPIAPAIRLALRTYFRDDIDAQTLAEFAIKALADQGVRTLSDVAAASQGRITEARLIDLLDNKVWSTIDSQSKPMVNITEPTIEDITL